jgi:hypothetical protein
VFAEIACPFTHVGLRRIVERRARLGRGEVALRIRAWPLEFVNGTPLLAPFVAEEIDELRAEAAPDLFAGFDPGHFPASTLPALALAAAAGAVDDATGEAVGLALRHSLFEDGHDVADPAVLATIAAAHGVPAPGPEHDALVRADWSEGVRRGVVGSPHYFVGDLDFFCPSLDVSRTDGRLHVRADREAFEAFLAVCFTT